ncbi:MAG: ABC transporter permease [Vicinamibacteria bacterium]|nr:ABC transporter permease [Vicinamibacteria bacterium]
MRELREAVRSLAADWRFTAVAVALLSLTIGASTAIYSIVHAVVLRPLPFDQPDRVAMIWQRDLRRAMPVMEVAYDEAVDWRGRSRSFDDVAVIGSVNWSLTLAGTSPSETLSMAPVSASFFQVVGRQPAIGRAFEPADDQGMRPRVAVISHGLWTRRFGQDTRVIGRALPVHLKTGGAVESVTIVGVMPAGFDFPRGTEIWLPAVPQVRMHADEWTGGDIDAAVAWLRVFYGIGRLRPGVTPDMAARELSGVIRATDTRGGPEPPTDAVVTGMRSYLLGPAEPVLWTLLGGATLILLVACANVAGLQVSRAARRERALAVRIALGARHGQLVRQSLLESVLLTGAALAGAVAICLAAVRGLLLLAPANVPRLDTVSLIDVRVLSFAGAAAFVTVLLSGLWPAIVVSRLDALSALAHGPATTAQPRGRVVQRLVVTAQVALALTLLIGTALFVRTVRGLDRTVLGFEPERLLAVALSPEASDLDRWNSTYAEIEARVATLPSVTSVGAVYLRPLRGPIGLDNQPLFPGQTPADPATWGLNPRHNLQTVTPGYFEAMGTRVVRGRGLLVTDTTSAPGVVVVSESSARRLWPGLDPIGQRLYDMSYRRPDGAPELVWQTVVGVVENVRYRGLNDVRLDLYVPAAQSNQRVAYLMVRARDNASAIVASVRAEAVAVDPSASVADAVVMSDVVASESAPWRFIVRVFLVFAAMAALLAAIGLGTVIALAVSTRRRELAIRAALGADRRRLRAVVMKEGTRLVGLGVLLGLACALALGRAVGAVLVGVPPHDPLALLTAAAVALAIGLAACWWPSRRAAAADPVEALRAE